MTEMYLYDYENEIVLYFVEVDAY